MSKTIKTNLQILVILLIAVAFLVGLSVVAGMGLQPQVAIAQAPLPSPDAARKAFTAEKLSAFGLSLKEIEAAALYDLQVSVTASSASIASGGTVTFTVTIYNAGPNPAQYILFSQSLPTNMSGGTPNFNGLTAISNGSNPSTWLITDAIASGTSRQIFVSGTFTTNCNTTASYIATAQPFNASNDSNTSNNTFTRTINVIGNGTCLFLPLIQKYPTPTPNPIVFYDNFSSSKNWNSNDDSDCDRAYVNDEFEVKAKTEDTDCFSPAPGAAERSYGNFKVKVRRESGSNDFTVGIYINGSGGGEYYMLQVKPANSCSWRLIRRKNSSSDEPRSGGCESAINRNSDPNILEIKHTSNGDISVFINGTQLGTTYNDGSQLTGTATGVYVRTNNSDSVTTRFDDFTVSLP